MSGNTNANQSGDNAENRVADFTSLSTRAQNAIGISPDAVTSYSLGGLAAAVAALGAVDDKELLIDRAETVSEDVTVTANIKVRIIGSGCVTVSGNKTVTFLGGLTAPKKEIFAGGASDSVVVQQSEVQLEWWGGFTGALPVTQAIASIEANQGGTVFAGVGNFDVKDNFIAPNCFIVGSGWNTSFQVRSDASKCGFYFVDGQIRRGIINAAIVDTHGKKCIQWQTPDAAVRTSGVIFDRVFCSSNVSANTVVDIRRDWNGAASFNPEIVDVVWRDGIIQAPESGYGYWLDTVNSKMDLINMQLIGGVGSTPIHSVGWDTLNVYSPNFSGVNMTADPSTSTNRTLNATAANDGTYGVGKLTLVAPASSDYFTEVDVGRTVTYNSLTYYIVQVLSDITALVNTNTGTVGSSSLVIKESAVSAEQANAAISGAFITLNVQGGIEEGFNYSLYMKDGSMTSQTANYSGYLYQGRIKLEATNAVQTFNDFGGICTMSNPFEPSGVGIKRVSVSGFILKNGVFYNKSVFEPKLYRTITAGLLRINENYVGMGLSAPAVATNFYVNNTYKIVAIQDILINNTAPITGRNAYNAGDAELIRLGKIDPAYDYYAKRSVSDGWCDWYGTQADPYKGFRFNFPLALPNLPTSSAGLPSGAIWCDTGASNVLKKV